MSLQTALRAAQHSATGTLNTSVNHDRAQLMRRYNGESYGDEVEGRSTFVDVSVRDVVESIKPELMEIFFGGDKVVEFAPRGDEDVDAAEQETELVNHIVQNQNDGFMVFLSWFHDALLSRNGYVKRSWDERLGGEVEEYENLTPQEFEQTVLAASEAGEVELEEAEQDEQGGIDVKLKVTPREPWRYRIEAVPPEEIIIHPEWTRLDFDGCPFVAHKRTMLVSDLIEMGFDRAQVEALPAYDQRLDNEETSQRHSNERTSESGFDATVEKAVRPVLVYENYIRHDLDGDGVAELLQVFTGDHGEILQRDGEDAVEEVRSAPFNVLSSVPQPHKHFGFGVADLVDDIAKARTVLMRQMLDNAVGSNNPDIVVDEDAMTAQTQEDLAVTGLSRVIRVRGGVGAVQYLQPPQLIGQTLAALEHLATERENRTGVTRLNQGLDADSLNKTFGGMKALMNAAQKKILLIARIFAETGVRALFQDIHADLRRGPIKRLAAKLRGEWVAVNPRTWVEREDMTVNVGLGTGDRDIQFERLGMILAKQEQGLALGMVGPEHIHHTLTKMLELSGFKDVASFFPEPGSMPPAQQPEQPDPAAMMVQVEAQKAQQDAAKAQMDAQLKREQMAVDAQLKREEIASRERIELAKLDVAEGKALLEDSARDADRAAREQ